MAKLNFSFLEKDKNPLDHPIAKLLDDYGKEVSSYTKKHFQHIVTSSFSDDFFLCVSLYIIVPEINTQYRIIDVNIEKNTNEVKVNYIPLKTNIPESYIIDISCSFDLLKNKIEEILTSALVQATFRHLISLIELKENTLRDYRVDFGFDESSTINMQHRI